MTRTNIRVTPSARSAASSLTQGVVSVSRTTSEIDTATRRTTRAAEVSPCSVRPSGWPCQVHSSSTTVPSVTIDNVAGSTTTRVKTGMNSQTRLTKKPRGSREAAATTRVTRYIATREAMLCSSDALTSRTTRPTTLALGSSRCSRPAWAATSSPNITCRISAAPPFRVFSTNDPFLRLPLQPHGHIAGSPLTNHSGVGGRSRRWAVRASGTGAPRAGAHGLVAHSLVLLLPVAACPCHDTDDGPDDEDRYGDDGDADNGREDVGHACMVAAVEAIAPQQGVAPEAGVLLQAGWHRAEPQLAQVQGCRVVLTERPARCEQTKRRQHHHRGDEAEGHPRRAQPTGCPPG